MKLPHKPQSRWVGKTDPKALEPINPRCGTQVDFAALSKFEGAQWRRGYVPIRRATGRVVENSGMTLATRIALLPSSVQGHDQG